MTRNASSLLCDCLTYVQVFTTTHSAQFDITQTRSSLGKEDSSINHGTGLPAELDFFKYSESGICASVSKRKATESMDTSSWSGSKRTRICKDVGGNQKPAIHRHQIKAKGSNVPDGVTSWEELKDRYDIAPLLLQNLAQSGYNSPTAIQAQGAPILLEVIISRWHVVSSCLHIQCLREETSLQYLPLVPEKRCRIWCQ